MFSRQEWISCVRRNLSVSRLMQSAAPNQMQVTSEKFRLGHSSSSARWCGWGHLGRWWSTCVWASEASWEFISYATSCWKLSSGVPVECPGHNQVSSFIHQGNTINAVKCSKRCLVSAETWTTSRYLQPLHGGWVTIESFLGQIALLRCRIHLKLADLHLWKLHHLGTWMPLELLRVQLFTRQSVF